MSYLAKTINQKNAFGVSVNYVSCIGQYRRRLFVEIVYTFFVFVLDLIIPVSIVQVLVVPIRFAWRKCCVGHVFFFQLEKICFFQLEDEIFFAVGGRNNDQKNSRIR